MTDEIKNVYEILVNSGSNKSKIFINENRLYSNVHKRLERLKKLIYNRVAVFANNFLVIDMFFDKHIFFEEEVSNSVTVYFLISRSLDSEILLNILNTFFFYEKSNFRIKNICIKTKITYNYTDFYYSVLQEKWNNINFPKYNKQSFYTHYKESRDIICDGLSLLYELGDKNLTRIESNRLRLFLASLKSQKNTIIPYNEINRIFEITGIYANAENYINTSLNSNLSLTEYNKTKQTDATDKTRVLNKIIFDENNIMLRCLRKKILKQINIILKGNARLLKDLRIVDVVLLGSQANYFYTEKSDIDIKIIFEKKDGRLDFIYDNHYAMNEFLFILSKSFNFSFSYNNLKFDISFCSLYQIEKVLTFDGKYSMLKNQWIFAPNEYIFDEKEKHFINNEYNKTKNKLEDIINDLHKKFTIKKFQSAKKYYADLYYEYQSINSKYFFAYRQLSKDGILRQFKNNLILESNRYLNQPS